MLVQFLNSIETAQAQIFIITITIIIVYIDLCVLPTRL